jgi:ribosomal protein S18 acetylase RimI-like enzyme
MTDEAGFVIEPLDPDKHDRAAFSCGVDSVDNFFKRTASKFARADNVRVFVMTDAQGVVAGFYALNAHSVYYEELPAVFARTRPNHGHIPAAYISMIGRDVRFKGAGIGGDLLVDCLRRIADISEQLGIAVAVLDVLNDGNAEAIARRKALYQGYGFQALPSQPLRLFIPTATLRKAFHS